MSTTLKAAVFTVLSLLAVFIVATSSLRQNSLTDAPSVKIHVTLKRPTMWIHGHSEFDVFAKPVVSADGLSVLYDGYASFIEDDTEFKYVLSNGVGYLVQRSVNSSSGNTVQCLSAVLPFDTIIPALNNVIPIPSASVGDQDVECSSGHLFKTTFAGTKFAVCVLGSSGFTAFASDMTIAVEYLGEPVIVLAPKLSDSASSCPALSTPTTVTANALAMLTGAEITLNTTSRKLAVESHMALEADTCECRTTPRPCIFFHGLGNPDEMGDLQDTPEDTKRKFGSIEGHAPCCSKIKYAVLNTVDYEWTDDELQQKYCAHALSVSRTSDRRAKSIKNTIVVTHSMGGLVMAGALATGKCSFDETTSWVALSPPMTGSMAVDYIQGICSTDDSAILKGFSQITGDCPVTVSRLSTAYQGGKFSNAELNAAYTAAQEAYRGNVTAAMCSNSYSGLLSLYKVPSMLGGETIPHKSFENDGLVEFHSCAVGLDASQFGTSYTSRFYMPELNHADTAFLAGEGTSDTQKPHKWFECLF